MTSYTTKTLAARLISSVLGPQPLIPIHRPFLELTGDYAAAAFLAQAMYLADRLADEDGWFDYTTEQWEADLQISRERLRRCQRICSDYVTIERRGIPCRNFFQINEEALTKALEELKSDSPSPLPSGGGTPPARKQRAEGQAASSPARQSAETVSACSPETVSALPSFPLEEQQENKDIAERIERGEASSSVKAPKCRSSSNARPAPAEGLDDVRRRTNQGRDDVRPPLRTKETDLLRLLEVFNIHRGRLPEASGLTAHRRRNLQLLLADCNQDLDLAVRQLEHATREVAQDEFWFLKRLGFDTLVPGKVTGKAEAWLSRQPVKQGRDDVAKPELQVGERVSYQREGYTVEEITPRYVELYDERNGSVRVLRSSPAWTSLRRLETARG